MNFSASSDREQIKLNAPQLSATSFICSWTPILDREISDEDLKLAGYVLRKGKSPGFHSISNSLFSIWYESAHVSFIWTCYEYDVLRVRCSTSMMFYEYDVLRGLCHVLRHETFTNTPSFGKIFQDFNLYCNTSVEARRLWHFISFGNMCFFGNM